MKKKDIIEEERQVVAALDNTFKGIVKIMGIANVGFYKTLQILDTLVKQGGVEKQVKGKREMYRKIDRIYFEDDNHRAKIEVLPQVS